MCSILGQKKTEMHSNPGLSVVFLRAQPLSGAPGFTENQMNQMPLTPRDALRMRIAALDTVSATVASFSLASFTKTCGFGIKVAAPKTEPGLSASAKKNQTRPLAPTF